MNKSAREEKHYLSREANSLVKYKCNSTKKYQHKGIVLAYTWCGRAMFGNSKDVNNVYKYTAKGNLVAVITNGTAVLGLEILVRKLQTSYGR
jgi:malate dehydrogenase (oxaloacetate-decarboxylating)(NADP+)